MDTVDRWLITRTFRHRQFAGEELLRCKEAQGCTLSVCIPTLNEAVTIGPVVACLRSALLEHIPLLDEIVVIDSGSSDRTMELAAEAGASVYRAAEILPETGHHCGKGENLWKALFQLKGNILVFLDADVTAIHPGFVTGLVGPLLLNPGIGYVKACYDRPASHHERTPPLGGGRVTEILARPLLSLHFPELTGFIQPLAGEFAARRSLLETIPFPVGYGVELAHLLDLHARYGLEIFAQTDLGQRCHRNRSLEELGRMALALLQVVERRLGEPDRRARREGSCDLAQYVRQNDTFNREMFAIDERERPPMRTIAAYRDRHGQTSLPPLLANRPLPGQGQALYPAFVGGRN